MEGMQNLVGISSALDQILCCQDNDEGMFRCFERTHTHLSQIKRQWWTATEMPFSTEHSEMS